MARCKFYLDPSLEWRVNFGHWGSFDPQGPNSYHFISYSNSLYGTLGTQVQLKALSEEHARQMALMLTQQHHALDQCCAMCSFGASVPYFPRFSTSRQRRLPLHHIIQPPYHLQYPPIVYLGRYDEWLPPDLQFTWDIPGPEPE
jgi:hypothetical protein